MPGFEEQTDHLSSSRGPDEIDLFRLMVSGLTCVQTAEGFVFGFNSGNVCVQHSLFKNDL